MTPARPLATSSVRRDGRSRTAVKRNSRYGKRNTAPSSSLVAHSPAEPVGTMAAMARAATTTPASVPKVRAGQADEQGVVDVLERSQAVHGRLRRGPARPGRCRPGPAARGRPVAWAERPARPGPAAPGSGWGG